MYQPRGMSTSTGARNTPDPSSFRANTSSFGLRKYADLRSQTQSASRPYGQYTDLFNATRDFNQQNLQQTRQLNLEQDTRYYNMGRSAYDHTAGSEYRYGQSNNEAAHSNNMDYLRQTQQGNLQTNALELQSNREKYASDERITGLDAASKERIAGISAAATRSSALIGAHSSLLGQFLQPTNFRYW